MIFERLTTVIVKTNIAVANSVIAIMDPDVGEVPHALGPTRVAWTGSCVAIGTLVGVDGETTITLSDVYDDNQIDKMALVFDGVVETPHRSVSVCSSALERLLTMPVHSERSRVRVWSNDESEPDVIHITVGA